MTIDTEELAPVAAADAEPASEPKADDLETVARELGWKPETEWKGDPPEGGFASAAEFIRSQRTRAKNVEKELKKLRSETEKRIKRMEEQSAKQREKEIRDLHAEYDWYIREAVKKGDDATEQKLIRERDAKLAEAREIEDEDDEDTVATDEEEWIEKFTPSYPQVQKRFYNEGHAWILDDDADPDAMRVMLDYVDSGIPFADALEKADRALRKAYPERYEDEDMDQEDEKPARPAKKAPVLAPGGRGAGGGVSAASRLSPAQREIGARFVKEGLFGSLEEYAEERLKQDA
ncbi:MAG: hypothetical protein RIR33_3705 [Pseudomonadota bacterium]|jgi:hypothetical protein